MGSVNPNRVVQPVFQVRVCPTFQREPSKLTDGFFPVLAEILQESPVIHLISKHSFPLWGTDANPTCPAFSQRKKKLNNK